MQIFPVPRKFSFSGEFRNFSTAGWFLLPENASFPLKNRVMEMARALGMALIVPPRVGAGRPEGGSVLVDMVRRPGIAREGYVLTASEAGAMKLEAADDAGFFYGMQTVCQLLREPARTPCCRIEDRPSLA